MALAGALLSLQVLWHILHLSSSDLVKLRWESAFENKKGKITIATILVIALILLWAAGADWSGAGITVGLLFGIVLPHTVGNMREQRRLTLERRTALVTKVNELRTLRQEGVAELNALLKDEDGHVRQGTVKALGDVGGPEALSGLMRALEDEHGDIRKATVIALGWIGGSKALNGMIRALEDPEEKVQSAAAAILARSDDAPAVDAMRNSIRHRSDDVRASAAMVLGRVGDARDVPALINLLPNRSQGRNPDDAGFGSDARARAFAAEALGKIGDARGVMAALGKGIGLFTRALEDISDPAASRLVPGLMRSEDKRVRSLAVKTLGRIGSADDFDVLHAALTDPDKEVRGEAVVALGTVGGIRVQDALRTALEDKDEQVRSLAARALKQTDDST